MLNAFAPGGFHRSAVRYTLYSLWNIGVVTVGWSTDVFEETPGRPTHGPFLEDDNKKGGAITVGKGLYCGALI